jgi:hypothetical protein
MPQNGTTIRQRSFHFRTATMRAFSIAARSSIRRQILGAATSLHNFAVLCDKPVRF